MKKAEMVAKLAESTGMTKKDAQKALAGVLNIISNELKGGGSVPLPALAPFLLHRERLGLAVTPRLANQSTFRLPGYPSSRLGNY